jgi:hypothetical protein
METGTFRDVFQAAWQGFWGLILRNARMSFLKTD